MKRVGFIGTSRKLAVSAQEALISVFCSLGRCELHHGGCIEADEYAHQLAARLGWRTVVRPGPLGCRVLADVIWPSAPNLQRNREIVDAVDVLVAAPFGMQEELRSGTWATIRYARGRGRALITVWPDGSVDDSFVDLL